MENEETTGRPNAEEILEFAARFAAGKDESFDSASHADLYGEDGLPE